MEIRPWNLTTKYENKDLNWPEKPNFIAQLFITMVRNKNICNHQCNIKHFDIH